MPGGVEDSKKNFPQTSPQKRKSGFENFQIEKKINNKLGNNSIVTNTDGTDIDKIASPETVINSFKNNRMKKLAKLRLKLAGLGMNNMTYQSSKPVKILKKKHPEVRNAKAPNDLKKRISKNRYSENIIPNTQGHSEMSTKARGRGYESNFSYYEGTKGTGRQLIRDPLGDPRDVAETVEQSKMTPDGKHTLNINTMKNKLKRKLAKVRKAGTEGIEDILRKTGSSKDGMHAHSTWLTGKGEYIGGGEAHINQIIDADPSFHKSQGNVENDEIVTNFAKKHGLIRVQSFPVNRAGESRTSFGIHHKPTSGQLRSMKALEDSGETLGHATGPDHRTATTGEGFKSIRQSIGTHFP